MSEIIVQRNTSPAEIYIKSKSIGSAPTVRGSLNSIAVMLGGYDAISFNWAALRYHDMEALKTMLLEKKSWKTVNKELSFVRGVLEVAWKDGLMSADDYQLAVSVNGIKGETLPAGRALSPGEISSLIATCEKENSPGGDRDAAIISVMYATGMRRSEVVNLDLDDYDPEIGQLVVRMGKGRKDRTSYILNGGSRNLAFWLARRGDFPGPLFVPITKSGIIRQNAMSPQALYKMLLKRAKQAGVANFRPHDVRRTHITDMLYAGADPLTVANLVGHKNVQTTMGYDMRGEDNKREAAGLLHVPCGR